MPIDHQAAFAEARRLGLHAYGVVMRRGRSVFTHYLYAPDPAAATAVARRENPGYMVEAVRANTGPKGFSEEGVRRWSAPCPCCVCYQ